MRRERRESDPSPPLLQPETLLLPPRPPPPPPSKPSFLHDLRRHNTNRRKRRAKMKRCPSGRERAVHRGLLEPISVGRDRIEISHLQYADDTMFVASGKKENAWAIKCILKLFELLSGLKVNFDKSCITGIGIDESRCEELAELLRCKVGALPSTYLGVKIGASFSRSQEWMQLGEKIKKKINGWNKRKLSFAGRLTLLRSVLLSLPIYQLSFAKIPKSVISDIRSILCKFLWGGGSEARKIHWIKWEELCGDLSVGGLGIKNLEWFNNALVAKWLWRFLNGKKLLWARVIRSSQGDVVWDGEGFKVEGNRGSRSGWWKRVLSLSRGVGGKWLRENLVVRLGEGNGFLFWHHCWAGEKNLAECFPRLFRLSTKQGGLIRDMGEWVEGVWAWSLNWSRELRGRDRDHFTNLLSIIGNFHVIAGDEDGWRWRDAADGMFSVKSAYKVLSSYASPDLPNSESFDWKILWKAPAPYKTITTAWKVLKGRVATSDNLLKRQVEISNTEALCILCKLTAESVVHLFFQCPKSLVIWEEILSWIGVQSVLHHKAKDHFLAFINLGSTKDKRLLIAVWVCSIWGVWKERNECKFNQGEWRKEKLISEIKTRVWSWKEAFQIVASGNDFRRWFAAIKLGD